MAMYAMHCWISRPSAIKSLAARPTHANELEFSNEDYVGYCNTSAFGAGGVCGSVEDCPLPQLCGASSCPRISPKM
eukprot:scaffold86391_cov52-Attheya_sp.AAC.2